MELFDFQNDCVDQLLSGFSKHRVQCLSWYTGAGKTNVFIEMCRILIESKPKIKIGVSAYLTTEIRDQIKERFDQFGMKDLSFTYGVDGGSPAKKNILIFNPQYLYNKDIDFDFDYLIIDESHAGLAEGCLMLSRIIKNTCTAKTKILLASATPWDVLSEKDFKNAPTFKRPLDQGLADGLITDFRFHAEEAAITFTEEDFTRTGDLGLSAGQRHRAILKSACIGKLEFLIENYDREIGKKCVVICPPGNYGEVARTMADHFDGEAYLQHRSLDEVTALTHKVDPRAVLERFKKDKTSRLLFVVNKCQVGFDMLELGSVIDMTMSRNIKVLAQRIGRVARKNGKQEKHYFYVYDQSLMKDRLEWLVATMIDFSLGSYDGWTTKSAKYRKTKIGQWGYREPFSTTLSEVVAALRDDDIIHNVRTLSYVAKNGPPTIWTLAIAKKEAVKYSSRTEMWDKRPALYKWFRLNAKAEMDQIFPLKVQLNRWNRETVEAAMQEHTGKLGRREFKMKVGGAFYWLDNNPKIREELLDKYFPLKVTNWNDEKAFKALLTVKRWQYVRDMGGLRNWFRRNGGEGYWKNIWLETNTLADTTDFRILGNGSKKRPAGSKYSPSEYNRLRKALDAYRLEREELQTEKRRKAERSA